MAERSPVAVALAFIGSAFMPLLSHEKGKGGSTAELRETTELIILSSPGFLRKEGDFLTELRKQNGINGEADVDMKVWD